MRYLRIVVGVPAYAAAVIGMIVVLSLAFGFDWFGLLEPLPVPILIGALAVLLVCVICFGALVFCSILVQMGFLKRK